jgi:hypothetical protein
VGPGDPIGHPQISAAENIGAGKQPFAVERLQIGGRDVDAAQGLAWGLLDAYNVAAVGDFNGDGYSDVLWRNSSTGDLGYSDLHNDAWHTLGGSSPAYAVVA